MPRLLKYSNLLGTNNPFDSVDDNYLRAVEYASFSYLNETYSKGSKINKAIMLALEVVLYEYAITNYYPPKETKMKDAKAIAGKDAYPIV